MTVKYLRDLIEEKKRDTNRIKDDYSQKNCRVCEIGWNIENVPINVMEEFVKDDRKKHLRHKKPFVTGGDRLTYFASYGYENCGCQIVLFSESFISSKTDIILEALENA